MDIRQSIQWIIIICEQSQSNGILSLPFDVNSTMLHPPGEYLMLSDDTMTAFYIYFDCAW